MHGLRYFVIYKPFGMLSQFTHEHGHRSLADLGNFPGDVYPVGRLDRDSEGLLILTNDKSLNHMLLSPANQHQRTYRVQVEGEITTAALAQLEQGVEFRIKGKTYTSAPAIANPIPTPTLPERDPPVRFRSSIPTSWLELTLTEGKNRQVRRMCAAVGFPCLRLVRVAIEHLELNDMQPSEIRELPGVKLKRLLKL